MDHSESGSLDSQIIARVKGGDVNAFEMLIHRYRSLVFGIVSKHAPQDKVEDVAQEVFLESYRCLSSFAEKGPFSHWISKIAVRCCYNFWRDKRRQNEVPISSLSEGSGNWLEAVMAARSHEAFQREAEKKEAAETLEYALDRLSPEDRMVVGLVHLDGLPQREAADLLGWSLVSVKVRAHRSRRKLRKIILDMLESRRGEA